MKIFFNLTNLYFPDQIVAPSARGVRSHFFCFFFYCFYLFVEHKRKVLQVQSALESVARYENLKSVLLHRQHVRLLAHLPIAEEELRVQVNRGTARILRHLVSVVHVVARLLQILLVEQLRVGGVGLDGGRQQSMHHNVSVAANGRREVSVDGRRQAVVVELGLGHHARAAEVERLHHCSGW